MSSLSEWLLLPWRYRGRVLQAILFTLLFILFLFPFGDLGDYVSTQIFQRSNNQVFLNFDRMELAAFPSPGIQFDQVYLETPKTSPLSSQSLSIFPSFSALIYQKPFGRIKAQGFMGGEVDISVGSGKRSEKGTERQQIDLAAEKVSLQEVRKFANIPLAIKGQLSLAANALTGIVSNPENGALSMAEQPEINDLLVIVQNFELPPATLDMNGFPVTIPGLNISQVELKGRLSDGRFYIESAKLGQDKDELTGTITGNMGVNVLSNGNAFFPQFGAYEFQLDLKVKRSFQDKMALYLLLVDQFKRPAGDGFQYRMKLSGDRFGPPPKMSALQ